MKIKSVIIKAAAVMLVMIISLLPFSAYAESLSGMPDIVFFGGVATTESGYWKINNKKEVVKGTESNYNIAYDAETRTLTLKDAELESKDFLSYDIYTFTYHCGIAAVNDININLIGKNKITVYESNHSVNSTYAIVNWAGDISISGGGKLEIDMENSRGSCVLFTRILMAPLSIKDIELTVNSDSEAEYFSVTGSDVVEIEDAVINVNVKNKEVAYGFHSNNSASSLKISNSDINMSFENCQNACGTEMYQTDIVDSNVDITVKNPQNRGYGIFAYIFNCSNSNVNCYIENCADKQTFSAVAYSRANINNDSMQHINTGSLKAEITPQTTYHSSVYINFGNSVFNPMENKYGDYFKAVNGSLDRGSESEWNVYYNRSLNRLYFDSAIINQPMRALGSADVVLTGDSIINCEATFALYCDVNQKFYGDGTLTLVSAPACAIMCAEGVEFDSSVIVTASTSADGSNPVEFNSEDVAYYKWIRIQPTETLPESEASAEETFFEKIINAIRNFFNEIAAFFRNLFS